MNNVSKINILGVPLDMVDMEEALQRFRMLMETEDLSIIVTPNSEIVVNAGKDPELLGIIKSANLAIPDGIGLVYGSRLLGHPLKERVTGIDFLGRILQFLAEEGKSVFLLGSKPGGPGEPSVAELAGERMAEAFPGLRVAGAYHGYFKEDEEESIVKIIKESQADFLCVALGSPKQEKFMARHKDALGARAAIGVGGSLDVWAGTVKRAPAFYQNHGLEWLYRLIQQPSRFKRIGALPKFMIKVLIYKKTLIPKKIL